MPTVTSYTMAFPGIPYPQHKSARTNTVQNYVFPGAVQPQSTLPTVTSYTMASPGIPAPQHKSGLSTVQNFIFPGAVQPFVAPPADPMLMQPLIFM